MIAAADHGSFRRAAAALGVQESAVSRRIRDLEYQLGAALFVRSASGVQLTQAGKQYVERSRQAIAQIGLAGAEVGAIGRGDVGELKIGIRSSIGSEFLTNLIREFVMKYPTVHMTFVDGDQESHVAAIRQRKLDIAFMTGNSDWPDCETKQIWTERVFVALPASHRLNTDQPITWKDLANERFIVSDVPPSFEMHDYIIKNLASPGHRPLIEHHAVNRFTLFSLVALERGITLACASIASVSFSGIVFRQIEQAHLPFSAVWSPQNDNPVFKRFLELGCAMRKAPEELGLSFPSSETAPRDERERTPDPTQ